MGNNRDSNKKTIDANQIDIVAMLMEGTFFPRLLLFLHRVMRMRTDHPLAQR
jgi:hypothetical protein